jgi:exonuclease III
MNNKQITSAGKGQDVSPVNTSLKQSITCTQNFIKLASHNIQGLSTTTKQQQLLTFLELNKIDIMGLSETKLSTANAQYIFSNQPTSGFCSWFNCEGKQYASGVGIVMSKPLAQHVRSCKGYKGRIIYIDLFFKGKSKIRIIQFYNFASSDQKIENIELYKQLFKYINEARQQNYYIIIMGDFNLQPPSISTAAQKKGNKKVPKWRLSIYTFLNNKQFSDVAAYLCSNPSPTWSNNNTSTRIDQFWISNNLLHELVSFSSYTNELYSSDHSAIDLQTQ